MKTAKLLKDNLDDFTGHAALYELSPVMEDSYSNKSYRYVICSTASVAYTGVETYIFPAYKNGKIKDWSELDGSERGVSSHEEVLRNIGYKIIK
jgi:hypothetical protein